MENKDKNLFDNEQLFLQTFLLSSDTEAIEGDSKGDRPTQKLKVRPNLLSIYAMVVTLLLVLSANNSMANNKQVAIESNLTQITSLSRQLEQSQARILALESKLIPIVEKAIATSAPQPEVAIKKTGTPQIKTSPSVVPSALPQSQLAVLPVPGLLPPPPPFFQSSPSFSALPIPQPAEPETNKSALIPLPIVEVEPEIQLTAQSVVENKVELRLDEGQWLGHTDTVYYSSSFEQSKKQSQIDITSSEATNKKLDSSVALSIPSTEVVESEIDSVTESSPLFNDEDLRIYLSSTPLLDARTVRQRLSTADTVVQIQLQDTTDETIEIDRQEIVAKAIAATVDKAVETIEESMIAKDEDNSLTNDLFSDEDLTRYLSSTPLLSDRTIQQKLATASTFAQPQSSDTAPAKILEANLLKAAETEEIASVVADRAVEAIEESVTAKLEDNSLTNGLFSEEDLTRYLASTPLLSDRTIQQKLAPASTFAQLQSLDTAESSVLEADKSEIVSSEAIEESAIARLEDNSLTNGLFREEDLTRYLSSTPLSDDDTIARQLNTASTEAKLNSIKVSDTIAIEVISKTGSQTSIPLAQIPERDLSSLEIEVESDSSQELLNDEDLAQYLTAVP